MCFKPIFIFCVPLRGEIALEIKQKQNLETCVSRFRKQQCLTTLLEWVSMDHYVCTTISLKGKCSQKTALNLKTRCQAFGFLCIHLRSQKYYWTLPELPPFLFCWKNRLKNHVNLRCPLLSQFLGSKRPFRGGASKESGDVRLQVFQTCQREISWFFGVKIFPLERIFKQRFFTPFLNPRKNPGFWPHFGERNFDHQNSYPRNPHFHPTHDIALQNLETHVSK